MTETSYLPDVNVLLALSDADHTGYRRASKWFKGIGGSRFLLCSITESGFVRLAASPHVGKRPMYSAMALLRQLSGFPNCGYLPFKTPLLDIVAPFASRLHGYRQVTDALLLGLAIESNSVLVTLDRGVEALAGSEYKAHLLTLQ